MGKISRRLRGLLSTSSSISSTRSFKSTESDKYGEPPGTEELELTTNGSDSSKGSLEDLVVSNEEPTYCQGLLGQGSQGRVRKGRWNGRDVAVKYIYPGQGRDKLMKERTILLGLNHENIIKLFHYSTYKNCLVMELAEGGSLYTFLEKSKITYKIEHALSWALQVARGISYMHQMKPNAIIHRDIKPGNILLQDHCRKVKICDFGLACNYKEYMTRERGTPLWMAPEVTTTGKYSEKCDVFSWAVTFWQMLTRKLPGSDYKTGNFYCYAVAIEGHRPPLIQGCPEFLEKLIVKSWAQKADDRIDSSQLVGLMEVIYATFVPQPPRPIYAVSDELYADVNDMIIEYMDEFYDAEEYKDLKEIMKLDEQNEITSEYAKLLIEEEILRKYKSDWEKWNKLGITYEIFEDEVDRNREQIQRKEEELAKNILGLEHIQKRVSEML